MIDPTETQQSTQLDHSFDKSKPNQPLDAEPSLFPPPPGAAPAILVVEDLAELAGLFREVLTLHGFEVQVAPDGASALRMLRERTFQLLLMDIDLPDFTGFEVVARARAAGLDQGTRIIFCSGGYVEERQSQALQFPGSTFLSKPFTIKQLMVTIADMLQAPNPA